MVLGVDLGKNVYSVAGLDPSGRVVVRRRMKKESEVDPTRGATDAGFLVGDSAVPFS